MIIMETNNIFSFQRFMMLVRQSVRVNKNLIGISLAGVTGTMFFSLVLFQKANGFQSWGNDGYFGTFVFFFFLLGIIFSSISFPAFRSKEKSMSYLLLPASTAEKFAFEFLTRIVAFIFFMPLLFWLVANLEGAIVHYFVPKFINYKFSFGQVWAQIINRERPNEWDRFAIIQVCLFCFIAVFTGASHFSKSPLIKTLFTFSIICCGYAFLAYILFKGLGIKEYQPSNDSILFINSYRTVNFLAITTTAVNLVLLAVAWFRLKEKEV
jgi:hypothetical protein